MSMDEVNKIAGAAIGALLLFLLLGFFSGQVFHGGGGGHHGEEETLAFALDTGEEEEEADAGGGMSLGQLAAAADPARGEKVFNKCKSCHKIEDGANGVGPHLWNVVGRGIGSVGGFGYSDALAGHGGDWDVASLDGFLTNPGQWAPGTIMGYSGLKDPADRMNLIAYLNQAGDAPIDLVESAGGIEEAAAEEEAASEEAAAEEPAAEEAASEEAASEEVTAEEPAEEESATEDAATEETTDEATAEEPAAETEVAAAPASDETEAAPEPSPFAPLLAAADADNGKKVFRKCRACHKIEEGKNGVGPSLWGVVGRAAGSMEGYKYSSAMAAKGGEWTLSELDGFLANPKEWVPGTKMGYAGLKDAQDRIDVITYLNEADGSPVELAAAAGAAPASTAVAESAEEPAPAAEEPAAEEVAAADPEPAEEAEPEATEEPEAKEEEPAETEEVAAAPDETEAAPAGGGAYAALLASADAKAGEKAFRKCKACHKVDDGKNGVGPHLWGVVGRDIASVDGYKYSDALSGKDGAWTLDNLMEWLANPKEWAPGTKMNYAMRKEQDRINVIVYLNEADGSPEALD